MGVRFNFHFMNMTVFNFILLQVGSEPHPAVRTIGFFIAMIILYFIWNVRNKKKDADKDNKME